MPLVLLVDDHEELRSTLAEALALEGFSVIQAADGREAVARARAYVPDVVAMDVSLPILDGAAAARVLRTYAPTSGIPVLAFTGLSVSLSEARSLGFDEVVRKPCAPDELAAKLLAMLRPELTRRAVER